MVVAKEDIGGSRMSETQPEAAGRFMYRRLALIEPLF